MTKYKDKFIQCCYCKSDNKNQAWITNWNNAQEVQPGSGNFSSYGCSNCKNYAEIEKEKNMV